MDARRAGRRYARQAVPTAARRAGRSDARTALPPGARMAISTDGRPTAQPGRQSAWSASPLQSAARMAARNSSASRFRPTRAAVRSGAGNPRTPCGQCGVGRQSRCRAQHRAAARCPLDQESRRLAGWCCGAAEATGCRAGRCWLGGPAMSSPGRGRPHRGSESSRSRHRRDRRSPRRRLAIGRDPAHSALARRAAAHSGARARTRIRRYGSESADRSRWRGARGAGSPVRCRRCHLRAAVRLADPAAIPMSYRLLLLRLKRHLCPMCTGYHDEARSVVIAALSRFRCLPNVIRR